MSTSNRTVPAFRRVVPLLWLFAAVAALAGCSRTLDVGNAEKIILDGLASQMGLEIASVTCPADPRPLKTGDEFECTGEPKEGGKIFVKVVQTDDQGNVEWSVTRSEGLYDMRKTESEVAAGLRAQAGVETTVGCGPAWRGGKVGDTFECSVETDDGRTAKAIITVTSLEGGINWAVE